MMKIRAFNDTQNGLRRATKELLKHYAKDPRAKNTMIKNITKQFRKPPEQEVYDHYTQLDRLLDYSDMLPTETPVPSISDAERKDYLFETFPMKWRKECIDTKTTDYYQAMVEDIIQFMKQKKQNVDQEGKQQKKKDSQDSNKQKHDEGGRDGGRFGQRG